MAIAWGMTAEEAVEFLYNVEEEIDNLADEFMALRACRSSTKEVTKEIVNAVLLRRQLRLGHMMAERNTGMSVAFPVPLRLT